MNNLVISASVLSADFLRLEDDLRKVAAAGSDWLHLDIMDGHFVPNLSFGMPLIKAVGQLKICPFDVHLMVDDPDMYLDACQEAGAELVTKLKWTLAHGDILDFNLHAYAMYDYPDSDKKWSAEGWEFPCYATLTYEMPVSKRVSFGVENDLYWKHSFYKNYSDATAVCYSAGIFARINF